MSLEEDFGVNVSDAEQNPDSTRIIGAVVYFTIRRKHPELTVTEFKNSPANWLEPVDEGPAFTDHKKKAAPRRKSEKSVGVTGRRSAAATKPEIKELG